MAFGENIRSPAVPLTGFDSRLRRVPLLSLLLALLPVGAARATPRKLPGFWAGLRTAYVLPMGAFLDGGKNADTQVSALVNGQVPLQLDLGWRFASGLQLGVYGQLGWLQMQSHCEDCSGSDLRFGVQATWHFTPRFAAMAPWLGLAAGRERTSLTLGPGSLGYQGWDAMFQVGADFQEGACFEVGPLLGLTLGVYKTMDLALGTVRDREDIRYQTSHTWLFLGVKGAYNVTCARAQD